MPNTFVVTIRTDNDAFSYSDSHKAAEVARILRRIADELESGMDDFRSYRTLRDFNGNDVGRAKMIGERD